METARQKQKHIVSLSSEVCFAHKDTSTVGVKCQPTVQNHDSCPLEGVKQTFKMAGISKPQIFQQAKESDPNHTRSSGLKYYSVTCNHFLWERQNNSETILTKHWQT